MKASFTLRLPEELRKKVMNEAKHNRMSLNQYVLCTLAKEISNKEAERALKERLKRVPSAKEVAETPRYHSARCPVRPRG